MDIVAKMKRDWDRRASRHARFWIATEDFADASRFDASGEATRRELLDLLAGRGDPCWTVLEIGCGIGRILRPLARDFACLYGVDVSREMIRRSRDWLQGLRNVQTFESSGVDLARFADGSIDLVYSHIAFQHMPKPVFEAYLAETNRVLVENGLLAFQIILGSGPEPEFEDTISLRVYDPRDLCCRLLASGFQLVSGLPAPAAEVPLTDAFLLARRARPATGEREGEWRQRSCTDVVSPLDDHLYLQLVCWYLGRGESGPAIETLRDLVRNNPGHLLAWSELVSVLIGLERLDEALVTLQAMLQANPAYEAGARQLRELRRRIDAVPTRPQTG